MKKAGKIKDNEVAMVHASSFALKILKKVPHLQSEEIIKKVLPFIEAEKMSQELEIFAIAAVNGVIKMRHEHNDLSDREIIERVVRELKKTG